MNKSHYNRIEMELKQRLFKRYRHLATDSHRAFLEKFYFAADIVDSGGLKLVYQHKNVRR